MQRPLRATILSTCCSLVLGLSACQTPAVVPLNVKAQYPERFVCERVDPTKDRPTLPPTYQIDWSRVQTVEDAHREHDSYVASIVDRNRVVSGYIVRLEGVDFTCWNNMKWQNDYYDALPKDPVKPAH